MLGLVLAAATASPAQELGSMASAGAPPAVQLAVADTARPALALPAGWRQVGRAQLKFWGFDVYRATLWAGDDFRADDPMRAGFALELRYDRDFPGSAIAQRSLQEMQRLGSVSPAQAREWLDLMTRAFPDVKKGDRLTGMHAGGVVSFFHNGQPSARVRDAEFARLFFGIWLSPQTPEPALREGLLAGARQ